MSIMDDIKALNAGQLSGFADCYGPDSVDSAGALFLTRVRDALVERVQWVRESDSASLREAVETVRDGDAAHEVADDAPSCYTHERWAQFVDLGAYNEDVTEYGEMPEDMTQAAAVALYMIADRLVHSLLNEIEQGAPQYVATINVPGYLPMDDEPPVFDSIAEAWEYLANERERAEDEAPFEGEPEEFTYSVTACTLWSRAETPHTTVWAVLGDTPGYDGDHDLGLVYSVTEVERED